MASIDKSKFQFVKRDDFASETIDAPAYSYWKSVMRQFFKKKSTTVMLGILIAIILMRRPAMDSVSCSVTPSL